MRLTLVTALLAQLLFYSHAGAADTLARIKSSGEIRLGYFAKSSPFSDAGPDKTPQGYSVELCQRVAAGIQHQLGLKQIKTTWVELGLGDRIKAVHAGRVDIECGTTTWTFTRQEQVDFSLMTFIDGGSVLAPADAGIKRISDAGGKRIAVIGGTTTEKALVAALAKEKIAAQVIKVASREEGFKMLTDANVDGFASDRFLLMNALNSLKSAKPLRLMDEDFSVEPYALALPRSDPAFRLAVNRSLAEVFRSGEISSIYERWLGRYGQPSLLLSALFYVQQVPE